MLNISNLTHETGIREWLTTGTREWLTTEIREWLWLIWYNLDKINRKYGNLLGDKILLKLDKVPRSGLGLSLASNRDHDNDRLNILVVAVKPTCPLSVKIGDELLEVNFYNRSKI